MLDSWRLLAYWQRRFDLPVKQLRIMRWKLLVAVTALATLMGSMLFQLGQLGSRRSQLGSRDGNVPSWVVWWKGGWQCSKLGNIERENERQIAGWGGCERERERWKERRKKMNPGKRKTHYVKINVSRVLSFWGKNSCRWWWFSQPWWFLTVCFFISESPARKNIPERMKAWMEEVS